MSDKIQSVSVSNTIGFNIFDYVEGLEKSGWKVDLYTPTKELPEFSTVVDYENKKIKHNNPKAYYTRLVFNRISNNIDSVLKSGIYRYDFKSDGSEKIPEPYENDPDYKYDHLYLVPSEINKFESSATEFAVIEVKLK